MWKINQVLFIILIDKSSTSVGIYQFLHKRTLLKDKAPHRDPVYS